MRVTITDVSRLANVSTTTVSHVINGTRKVNEETSRRVLEAIKKTGYIPNLMAKGLKQSSTNTIGLVVSDIKNEFFTDIIHVIDAEARKDGMQVFVSCSDEDPENEQEIIRAFCERRVDGIIYSPTKDSDKYSSDYLKRIQIPVVMIDRCIGMDFDWVGVENYESTKKLLNHVMNSGHKKIGLLAGFRGINTTDERIRGYCDFLEENNLEKNNDWIISGNYRQGTVTDMFYKQMSSGNPPTAWVAANNRMVFSALEALKALNLSVPKDVALASFGDFEWTEYLEPHITSLVQPCNMIGKEAYSLLNKRIKNINTPIQRITLSPELAIRTSCGEK